MSAVGRDNHGDDRAERQQKAGGHGGAAAQRRIARGDPADAVALLQGVVVEL